MITSADTALAPSCVSCRPCFDLNTNRTVSTWRSTFRRIPSSCEPDVYPVPSSYLSAAYRIRPALHIRYAPTTFLMPVSCVPAFARMPVHSFGLVSEGQPTFRIDAPRHTSRLARGAAPSNPGKPKGRESGESRQARP